MSNKYIKFNFSNARFFLKNERTNDYVTNVSLDSKGNLIITHSKRAERKFGSFREPITVHQVSNMLHTIVGERPVSSFRENFYKRNEFIFNIAKSGYLKINSPKIKKNIKGEEVECFIEEFVKVNKSTWNSWSKPNSIQWFKIKKYFNEDFDEFINLLCNIKGYNVLEEPFENLLGIAEDNSDFNELISWLKTNKKTPIINFLKSKSFDRSEITRTNNLGETISSGIDRCVFLSGEILIPYNEEFVSKIIKSSTNILDGGLCKIVAILHEHELENIDEFIAIKDISDEKY